MGLLGLVLDDLLHTATQQRQWVNEKMKAKKAATSVNGKKRS